MRYGVQALSSMPQFISFHSDKDLSEHTTVNTL